MSRAFYLIESSFVWKQNLAETSLNVEECARFSQNVGHYHTFVCITFKVPEMGESRCSILYEAQGKYISTPIYSNIFTNVY